MSRTYRTKKGTNEKITDNNSNKVGCRRCHCLLCETNRMHGTKKRIGDIAKIINKNSNQVMDKYLLEISEALEESEKCNPIIVPKSAYESNEKMIEWIKGLGK